MDLAWLAPSASEVTGQAGLNLDAPMEAIDGDASGVRSVRIPELGRIALHLGAGTSAGYLNANGTCVRCRGQPAQFGDRSVLLGAGIGLYRHV